MKTIYVVLQFGRPVIATESREDAEALAEKLRGGVDRVMLVEERHVQRRSQGLR